MTQVPDTLLDFARRLLVREARNGSGDDIAGAMQRGCKALETRLAPLIGLAAFEALIARAVTLAARNFSFLNDTTLGPNCSADNLRQAVQGHEQREVTDAVAAILANFFWLLVIFTGENIGMRIVQETWPDVRFKAPASFAENIEQ